MAVLLHCILVLDYVSSLHDFVGALLVAASILHARLPCFVGINYCAVIRHQSHFTSVCYLYNRFADILSA